MLYSWILLTTGLARTALAATWIVPGTVWKDTSGNTIDAHGGMIYQRESTFYWIGQSASNSVTPYLYESQDLLNWTPKGAQASIQWLWRPKLAKPNGSFWIYGQVDRLVQPLISSSIDSGYSVHGSSVTLPPNSYTYSDTGMFMDPGDQTWYLLTSADHNTVQVNAINSDGTIGARKNYVTSGAYEAPGMFKVDNVYFLIVSGKTGWRSNPNKMFWASGISGSFQGPYDIAPTAENTYNSQNTFELTIKGSQQTTYIYMGDSWDSTGGPSSTYIWLPMAVSSSAHTVSLQYHAMWKVDTKTGVVSYPTTKKRYEAEDAVISGRAAVTQCHDCISKRSVHHIDSQSEIVFRNVTGTGELQWVSFHYTVNNPEAGEAHITVNDQLIPTNLTDLNTRAGYQKTVPVELMLTRGEENTIKFGAIGSEDFEIHLDGIEIHEDA